MTLWFNMVRDSNGSNFKKDTAMKKLILIFLLTHSSINGADNQRSTIELSNEEINSIALIDSKELEELIRKATINFLKRESQKNQKLYVKSKRDYFDIMIDLGKITSCCLLSILIEKHLFKNQNFTYSKVT